MKALAPVVRIIFPLCLLLLFAPETNAQIWKKIKKRSEKAAEEAIIRKTEEKVYKETSKTMDSVLNPETGKKEPAPKKDAPTPSENPGGQTDDQNTPGMQADPDAPKTIQIYSKFDFVPGDKVLFFDDFSNDFIGDFPAQWNTNGSGEVVTIGDDPQKWLELLPGYFIYYIPDIPTIPEEFTVEFDLLTYGIDKKTSSTTGILVSLTNDAKFKAGTYYANAWLPIGQYGAFDIRMRNHAPGVGSEINSSVQSDIRQAVVNKPHISIAVNKQRYRLWVNEKKYVDIPRMIPENAPLTALKFNVNGLKDGKERIFIANLKVAEGGLDLRRKLINEGSVSTNGILFDSGSANIQPQSMGIIRQISQVLKQETDMRLNIIGHTDSDGDDASNLDLSKRRAEAVKNALVTIYNVSTDRVTTEGKGESEPVADNGTADGKAQNRRVVFKKI